MQTWRAETSMAVHRQKQPRGPAPTTKCVAAIYFPSQRPHRRRERVCVACDPNLPVARGLLKVSIFNSRLGILVAAFALMNGAASGPAGPAPVSSGLSLSGMD